MTGRSGCFVVELRDAIVTEYAFDTDILVEGARETRTVAAPTPLAALPDQARPVLAPATRCYLDEAGDVCLAPSLDRIEFERGPVATAIRRTRREITIAGDAAAAWRLLRLLDGRPVAKLVEAMADCGEEARRLLAMLAEAGAVDASGRPYGRFLHTASHVGVLPNGGLSADAILDLVTDGGYRTYPDAPMVPVATALPPALDALHAVIRRRRSPFAFAGGPLARADFDGLLTAACGITGEVSLGGRPLQLRAYPSGGGLYAVEVYPMVFDVAGLDPGVYHYRAGASALELLHPGVGREAMLAAALPSQRPILDGVAAMICLTGVFPRFERKYGEGSNRVLAAEAGHLAQNLLLAATALGLQGRTCGGFFDALVNSALGLESEEEQFLLAVLIGRA